MKWLPATKTFVRQECTALCERFMEEYEKQLMEEIESLAASLQHSFNDIENRLARLEAAVLSRQPRKP